MGKYAINAMIQNMKKAGLVTNVSPWLKESGHDVRHVGIRPKDWDEVMSHNNNLLCTFRVDAGTDRLELMLANSVPFIRLTSKKLPVGSKWESILGDIKRRLNKDKQAWKKGDFAVGNLYHKIHKYIKT